MSQTMTQLLFLRRSTPTCSILSKASVTDAAYGVLRPLSGASGLTPLQDPILRPGSESCNLVAMKPQLLEVPKKRRGDTIEGPFLACPKQNFAQRKRFESGCRIQGGIFERVRPGQPPSSSEPGMEDAEIWPNYNQKNTEI